MGSQIGSSLDIVRVEGKKTTENKTPEDEILEPIRLDDLNRDDKEKRAG